MVITLQNLPQAYTANSHKKLATWIFKYQKFATKAALTHAPSDWAENSLRVYLSLGLRYLNDGTRDSRYNFLYNELDILIKNCTQPLTPSESERRIIKSTKKYQTKDAIPPVAKLEIVKKPITAKFQYGLQFKDFVKMFETEDAAFWFNKGIEHAKGEIGKLVTVELGEV